MMGKEGPMLHAGSILAVILGERVDGMQLQQPACAAASIPALRACS